MSKIEDLFNDYYKESDETVDTPDKISKIREYEFFIKCKLKEYELTPNDVFDKLPQDFKALYTSFQTGVDYGCISDFYENSYLENVNMPLNQINQIRNYKSLFDIFNGSYASCDFNESYVKLVNKIMNFGITYPDYTASDYEFFGEYRIKNSNDSTLIDNGINFKRIPLAMENLFDEMNKNFNVCVIERAGEFIGKLIKIRPFELENVNVCKFIINCFLIKNGLLPITYSAKSDRSFVLAYSRFLLTGDYTDLAYYLYIEMEDFWGDFEQNYFDDDDEFPL